MTNEEFERLQPGDTVIGTCLPMEPYSKTYKGWIGYVISVQAYQFTARTLTPTPETRTAAVYDSLDPGFFMIYQNEKDLTYKYV
jgi:hypothetical protein